MENKG